MARPSPGRNRRRVRRLLLGLAVGAACALVVGLLQLTDPMRVLEWKTYDLRMSALADPAEASPDIVVVEIDDNSLELYRDRLGRWPWSRDVYEAMLAYMSAAGARLVVFDVLFPEPNLVNPLGDTIFADALAATNLGVLAFTLSQGTVEEAAEWRRSLEAAGVTREDAATLLSRFAIKTDAGGVRGTFGGWQPATEVLAPPGPEFAYAETPLPMFLAGARGAGSVVLNPDADGVARADRPLYRFGGKVYPSLAMAAAAALEPNRFGLVSVFDGGAMLANFSEGGPFPTADGPSIPLDADGRMLLRFHGPYRTEARTTYATFPAFRVLTSFEQIGRGLEPDLPLETFKDKIVLVGVTAVGTTEFEVRPTPVSATDPGVMIHATAIDNLLAGDAIRRAGLSLNLALLMLSALGCALLVTTAGSAGLGALLALLQLGAVMGVGVAALAWGVWIDLAGPLLGGSLAIAGGMGANYWTEGREKRRVRGMFSRYVSPEYVRRLADDFESLSLGGERVEITILFSDIRGFTAMTERLPANQVLDVLNEYLDRMAEVVFKHGGTLDKFIGDAVMAFWGAPLPAPDHARRAAETALDMIAELAALNVGWAARGAPTLAIGVGVNTGEAVVGNIGSLSHKLDYTAIGDSVNLASRIESLNKDYGTSILVSESTALALGGEYDLEPVEAVTVKGKTKAVEIFELKGRRAVRSLLLVVAAVLACASSAHAQAAAAKARWTDWFYRPGTWVGRQLVPLSTRNPDTDSLALTARVEVYSLPPRWRAEISQVANGQALSAPLVLLNEGRGPVVITAVGATPLAQHAAANDPVVLALLKSFGPDGRPVRRAPARIVNTAAAGTIDGVTLRRAVARADFDDALLSAGTAGRLGRSLGAFSVESLSGERKTEVTASAGARGVTRVRTPNGEIIVVPDTAAVRRMEQVPVDLLEFERFIRDLQTMPGRQQ